MHTPSSERFMLPDTLRGFAIFGIFGVNMVASAMTWSATPNGPGAVFLLGEADKWFQHFLDAFIEGKFYSIFSLLFGIGFGLQLAQHHSAGRDGIGIFKRRLWGMLLIGFMHMMLLWLGDIVFLYAWLGFVLIAFRNKPDRFLLRGAVFCLAVPLLLYPFRMLSPYANMGTPVFAALMGIGKLMGIEDIFKMDPVAMLTAPDAAGYFLSNVIGFFFRQGDLLDQVRPFKVFAMFLLGLWVSRHRWYQYPERFVQWFRPYFSWVFPLSVLANMGMALISWDNYYQGNWQGGIKALLYAAGVVPLSVCYMYLFVRAWMGRGYKLLHPFSYVGRMALSNYLFQSVVYVLIFRGPFLAMAGKVGQLWCMVPVLVIFPLQVVFSRWWLQHYRYGPAEWLWRSMTYGKWQPLRRQANGVS